jgi:hypothetical protein
MTPYAFMKDMLECAQRKVIQGHPDMVEAIQGVKELYEANTHVNFVFPSGWAPAEDIKVEAAERFNTRPKFPMPYKTVAVLLDSGQRNSLFADEAYSYSNLKNGARLDRESCYVFFEQDEDRIHGVVCSRSENSDAQGYQWTTCTPIAMFTLDHNIKPASGDMGALSYKIGLISSDIFSGNKDGSLDDSLSTTAMEYATSAFGALWSLMAKGVETEEVPSSPKLDKKNKAKGLPRTTSYVKVKINEPTRSYRPGELGSTHASPRPHWRRGHLRRLGDGRDTYVRPCLVGGESGSYCDPGLKMYKCELASLGHTT